ncbi:hypothetical protein CU044_5644 [Streptomyces sp. L-9-10]|nr:hypothetical protein CU044_5644 [Streptomyces sp. L-9-10]
MSAGRCRWEDGFPSTERSTSSARRATQSLGSGRPGPSTSCPDPRAVRPVGAARGRPARSCRS